nr:unnamed protein product [Digitaria exilis]
MIVLQVVDECRWRLATTTSRRSRRRLGLATPGINRKRPGRRLRGEAGAAEANDGRVKQGRPGPTRRPGKAMAWQRGAVGAAAAEVEQEAIGASDGRAARRRSDEQR